MAKLKTPQKNGGKFDYKTAISIRHSAFGTQHSEASSQHSAVSPEAASQEFQVSSFQVSTARH
jgi:hypothetical protein